MLSPINGRLPIHGRLNEISHLLGLTFDEKNTLDHVIQKVSSLNQNNQLIQSNIFQKPIEFLHIHKEIDQLKTDGKLTSGELKLIRQINETIGMFEKIVLQALNTGNSREFGEVKKLHLILDKLHKDPLLKNKISPELYQELETLSEKMKALGESYQVIDSVNKKIERYEDKADEAIESMAVQQEALEHGNPDFAVSSDLAILKVFDKLVQLYKHFEHKDSLPLYYREFVSKLTQELYAIRFHREEFCTEYQAAVETEVLRNLQAIHQTPVDPLVEKQYEALLNIMQDAKSKIAETKSTLDGHIDALSEPEEGTEKLFHEIHAIRTQLDHDLKFLENQMTKLSERQSIGWMGRWTLYSRGRQIEHNVRIVKEVEEDKPIG